MKQVCHWALQLLKWPLPGVLRGLDPSKHHQKELGKEMVCLTLEPENKHSDVTEWNQSVVWGGGAFFLKYCGSGSKENNANFSL